MDPPSRCLFGDDERNVESMTTSRVITKLLRITGLRIVAVDFKTRAKELRLCVKPYKNGCRCPTCGRRGKIKRIMPEVRIWRDVCVCGWVVYLLYTPKEIELSDAWPRSGGNPLGSFACAHHVPTRVSRIGLRSVDDAESSGRATTHAPFHALGHPPPYDHSKPRRP